MRSVLPAVIVPLVATCAAARDGGASAESADAGSPRTLDDWLQRARREMKENQFEAALQDLRAAEKLDPDSLRVLRAIGAVLARLGRPKEAAQYYRRSRALLDAGSEPIERRWPMGDYPFEGD
jgi:Flp pilus assembly protein TadD